MTPRHTMRTRLMLLPAVVAGMIALIMVAGGCSSVRQPDSRIYLAADEPIALEIESFAGDVLIEVDDQRDNIKLIVTREGTHGFGREEQSRASLDLIDYYTEVISTERGRTLRIVATTSYDQPELQRANIRIAAPAIDGVKVRTKGRVRLEMIRGPVDVVTEGGRVQVLTAWPMTEPVTIINNDGPIDYRVRGESTGRFDCMTIGGQVSAAVRYGAFRVLPPTKHDVLLAVLNDGENPIELRAIDGDIRIAVMADPMEVGGMIWP